MKIIHTWLNGSIYTEPLSPACKMCKQGAKMVLLVTGICSTKCFYCPLSTGKLGKDRIFANEWELENEEDTEKLIHEAELIKASGAGITGGDPLIVWERTKKYILILKERFGSNFHIHMYTSGLKNSRHITDLASEGLDEIRFHPKPEFWRNMNNSRINPSIKNALKTNMDVAIEIPVIPYMENDINKLIEWADKTGINWVNLNELEYSETNAKILNEKGFTVKNDISAAVRGSEECAYNIIHNISEKDLKIGIHYCSASFKDATQLRNRIIRRAKSIAKTYEIITDEGTLIKGVIYSKNKSLNNIYNMLKQDFNIENNQLYLNKDKKRIEINILLLQKIAENLKKKDLKCYIVEEYPTADALEVERISMPV